MSLKSSAMDPSIHIAVRTASSLSVTYVECTVLKNNSTCLQTILRRRLDLVDRRRTLLALLKVNQRYKQIQLQRESAKNKMICRSTFEKRPKGNNCILILPSFLKLLLVAMQNLVIKKYSIRKTNVFEARPNTESVRQKRISSKLALSGMQLVESEQQYQSLSFLNHAQKG